MSKEVFRGHRVSIMRTHKDKWDVTLGDSGWEVDPALYGGSLDEAIKLLEEQLEDVQAALVDLKKEKANPTRPPRLVKTPDSTFGNLVREVYAPFIQSQLDMQTILREKVVDGVPNQVDSVRGDSTENSIVERMDEG